MNIQTIHTFPMPVKPGYTHAANVKLRDRDAMLFLYTDGPGVDPGEELLRFEGIRPMRLAMYEMDGTPLWEKVLPSGVLPGIWFVPAVPFDMDQDGEDEIYFINNTGAPFSLMHRKLERLNAQTGETTGTWPWPANTFDERLSLCYRFYIVAGYAHGEPVLVTCQGTYGNMYLQGWNRDMEKRWDIAIKAEDPGPRASHTTPVMDFNGDGVDELFWGERLISLDDGHEVADFAPEYRGHSDVIVPFQHYATGDWYLFTCREGDEREGVRRVVTFNAKGDTAWSALDVGHIHDGWVATALDGYRKIVYYMSQHFVPDDSGFEHETDGVFYADALTGELIDMPFPCPATELLPIDLDGDGYHEFLVHSGERCGQILNRHGQVIGCLPEGCVHTANGRKRIDMLRIGKMVDHPGEHIMVSMANSRDILILADADAQDGEIMRHRYSMPYLNLMQKLMATGYNSISSHVTCGV